MSSASTSSASTEKPPSPAANEGTATGASLGGMAAVGAAAAVVLALWLTPRLSAVRARFTPRGEAAAAARAGDAALAGRPRVSVATPPGRALFGDATAAGGAFLSAVFERGPTRRAAAVGAGEVAVARLAGRLLVGEGFGVPTLGGVGAGLGWGGATTGSGTTSADSLILYSVCEPVALHTDTAASTCATSRARVCRGVAGWVHRDRGQKGV